MNMRKTMTSAAIAGVLTSVGAGAQKPPAVRAIGRVERITTDPLTSAATALPMPGGHVLVNDMTGRRLLLFDSTLAHPVIVADTTDVTANAYGSRQGTLIRYRGDTALFIDVSSLSMLVISPVGKIERVMAIPRPNDAQALWPLNGMPGFDAHGRLVYHGAAGLEGTFILCCIGTSRMEPGETTRSVPKPDSAFVVRVDLSTRALDTAATVKIAYEKQQVNADAQGFVQSIETRKLPLPIVDLWGVTSDGSIAIVRGRDYRVDWLDASGHWTSYAKMPFDWQHISDERKLAIIDSSTKAEQAARERSSAMRAAQLATRGVGAASGGTNSGRGGGGGGRPLDAEIPIVVGRVDIADVPDYVPPFTTNALYADGDNNLWIRTSTVVDGRPVYDIVNHRGELFDRVQLPPYRTIAGFGPGVVYMAVKDNGGIVHVERARLR